MAAASTKPEALVVTGVRSVPKIGVWAWSVVGVVAATVIVVTALGAVSEIVLLLVFAAVLAVIAGDAVGRLRSRGFFELVADRAEPTIQKVLN